MSPITVGALIVICGIVASNGQTAQSGLLTCYMCTQFSTSVGFGNTDNCGGLNSNTPTCQGASCTKTTASASSVASSTIRGCGATTSTGCSNGNAATVGATVCSCTTNFCNSATRGTISGIAMTAATGLVLAMIFAGRLL